MIIPLGRPPDVWVAARELTKAWDRAVRNGKAERVPRKLQEAVVALEAAVLRCDHDAGCVCAHPAASHEPGEYAPDGTAIRPICTVEPCPCGDQWRDR
jgi:hypothetical protein